MIRLPGTPWIRRSLLGLALTGLACASIAGWWSLPFVDGLDRQVYDSRLRHEPPVPSEQVVIVDIDERSLAEVGRWPWSRSTVASLAGRLTARGHAAVVGFDILFAEEQAQAGEDEALAASLAAMPAVLGYYFSSDRDGRTSGQLPAPVMQADAVAALRVSITDWSGYGSNLPVLQSRARGAGFFNPIIDPDGVVRRLPLLGRFGEQVYESFALAVLREYLGASALLLRAESLQVSGARGTVHIPVSQGLSAMVPFGAAEGLPDAGRIGAFRVVSAADVLSGNVDWSVFAGRIVLIGTSAPGLSDLRATPVSATSPGVGIHATLIAAALAGAQPGAPQPIRQHPADAQGLSVIAAALAGTVLAFGLPALGAVGMVLLGAAVALALVGWDLVAYGQLGWVLPAAGGLALVLLLTTLNLALGYFVEGRARREVAHMFGEYVSPELVERMTRDPMRFRNMSSENRELSIMFADIRGFTRIAESMEPGDLREFINEFLTAMTEVIHRHHGTVDKYIGDAVMAFWGAPLDDPRHADHAVSAALAMEAEVIRLNRAYARRGWPTLSVGIGINTGVARVGDMGSRLRRAYTVLGDAVNLASRIESLTKQFGAPIIVGEATARLAQSHVFSELAQVSVAGRSEPVRIYVPGTMPQTRPAADQRPAQVAATTRESGDEASRLRV
jgi:adenylate cyclase